MLLSNYCKAWRNNVAMQLIASILRFYALYIWEPRHDDVDTKKIALPVVFLLTRHNDVFIAWFIGTNRFGSNIRF